MTIGSWYVCFYMWLYVLVVLLFWLCCEMLNILFSLWCRYLYCVGVFPFRILCRIRLIDRYCLNLVLSWNILVSPFMLVESFAGYSSLGWHLCSFSLHDLLPASSGFHSLCWEIWCNCDRSNFVCYFEFFLCSF